MSFDLSLPWLRNTVPGRALPRPGTDPDPEEQGRREQGRAVAEYQVPAEETALVRFVEQRYARAKRAKDPYLRTWATSLAFYVGEHYREWSQYRQQLVGPGAAPSWRVRITDEQVMMLANTIAAKRAKSRHITFGQPNNPEDDEDVAAADLATRVLRHLDRITERSEKRVQLELSSTIYGTSFLLPYWDPHKSTQVAFVGPGGRVRGQEAWIGDLDWEVLDVWQVFPQPVQEWKHVEWAVVARVRTLEWVRTMFPEAGPRVTADNAEVELFASLEGPGAAQPSGNLPIASGSAASNEDDTVRVLEYYEKASRRYPQGRFIVVANGVRLWSEEQLPHPKARFPIIPYYGLWIPGRLWGRGWVEALVNQQRQLNRTESAMVEQQNLNARGKWAIARESKIDEDALHSGPEVVEYNQAGGPPVPITPAASRWEFTPEMIVERMQRIAGIHEVSTGATPSNVSSGVAIDLIQQADESRLSIPAQMNGKSWRTLDQYLLEMAQAYYDVPRLIRTVGRGTEAGVVAFLGTDLGGNTEVGLEEGESVSDSIAAKRQRLLDYLGAQMFNQHVFPLDFQIRVFTLMNEMDIVKELQAIQQEQLERQRQEALAQQQAAEEQEQAHNARLYGHLLGRQLAEDGHEDEALADPQLAALLEQQAGGMPPEGATP